MTMKDIKREYSSSIACVASNEAGTMFEDVSLNVYGLLQLNIRNIHCFYERLVVSHVSFYLQMLRFLRSRLRQTQTM